MKIHKNHALGNSYCSNVLFLKMQNSSLFCKSVTSCPKTQLFLEEKDQNFDSFNIIHGTKILIFKLGIGQNLFKICELRRLKEWTFFKHMQIGFLLVLGQKLENGKISLSDQCFALISYCDGTNGFAMLPKACKSMALIQ